MQRYLFFCSSGSNPRDFYVQSAKYNGAEGFAYSRETIAYFSRMFLYSPLPYEPWCMILSAMSNVTTMQRCRRRAIIQMNEFCNINALMVQRCKRCTFDSPGLTSESVVYPGSFAISEHNAVGVVPFILCRFIAAFHAENVQHLRRWPLHYMHNPG